MKSIKKPVDQAARCAWLESEVERLSNFQTVRGRYALAALPSGMLVQQYLAKEEPANAPHYACATCMGAERCSVLQPVKTGTLLRYVCHGCGAVVRA